MTTPWEPSPIWKGETVAVLASGPRMSQEVAESLRCHRTIAINFTCRLAPWADMLVALDLGHPILKEAESFAGMLVCAHPKDGLDALCAGEQCELVETGPGKYSVIMNSGLAAIGIAARMGAAKIILAGFDPSARRNFCDGEMDIDGLDPYAGVEYRLATMVAELRADGVVVEYDPSSATEPGLSTAQALANPSIR